ncbi:uncharacterized protein V3H82_014510 [Fundulus diaphanus]
MSASAWVITWVLLSQPVFCWSQHQRNISAEAGQTVSLPCRYPDDNIVSVVGWSRTDLMDEYVLLYRDEEMDKSHQKPSYWDRVDLQNRLMQNGDVSLVLKDARTSDSGTYECRVDHSGLSEGNLGNGPICTIHLDVAPPPPGNKDGDTEDQDEGNQDGGSKGEGNLNEGNKDGMNNDGGNLNEGNKDGGNQNEGNRDGGNHGKENKDDGNKDEGNQGEETRGEANQNEGNKDEGDKDEGNKDEGNQHKHNQGKDYQDEWYQDGGNKDEKNLDGRKQYKVIKQEVYQNEEEVMGGSILPPIVFMFLLTAAAFLIVRVRCVRRQIFRERMHKGRLL